MRKSHYFFLIYAVFFLLFCNRSFAQKRTALDLNGHVVTWSNNVDKPVKFGEVEKKPRSSSVRAPMKRLTERSKILISDDLELAVNPRALYDGNGYTVTYDNSNCVLNLKKLAPNGSFTGVKDRLFTEYFDYETCGADYSILPDGHGGIFAAQYYFVVGGGRYDVHLRVQHFSDTGERLWGDGGTNLDLDDGDWPFTMPPAMALNSRGGVIVAVHQYFKKPDETSPRFGISVHNFGSDGTLQWTTEISAKPGAARFGDPVLVSDLQGGVILSYTSVLYGFSGGRFPAAQRINNHGTLLWNSGSSVRIGDYASKDFNRSAVICDGQTVLISWMGMKSRDNGPYLFVQKIGDLASGNLAWEKGGVLVSSDSATSVEHAMISDGDKGAWLAWNEYTYPGGTTAYLYARHILESGNFDAPAIYVFDNPEGQFFHPAAVPDFKNGMILTWLAVNAYFGQRIDSSGTLQWGTGIKLTNDMHSYGSTYQQMAPGSNKDQLLLIWNESRAVYGQRINSKGEDVTLLPLAVDEKAELPKEFSLSNYPNPFNPATAIRYTLPAGGHVTLKVTDLLGREIATLVDTWQSAGDYKVPFNAGNLSSGVYLYNLQTENGIRTQKMLLTK